MQNKELQEKVEELSWQFFQRPFLHNAVFNARLKTTGGRYHLSTHHLDFNPKVLEVMGIEGLDGVIKHELCHYHLHLEGKGHQHKDRDFKELLKQTGGLRYVPQLVPDLESYGCQCLKCGFEYKRKRKMDTNRYVCGKCKGRLSVKK